MCMCACVTHRCKHTLLTAHKAMMAITMKIIATPAATMIGQYSKGAVVVVISGFNSNVSYEHRSKGFRALGASQSTTVARAANEAQYRS